MLRPCARLWSSMPFSLSSFKKIFIVIPSGVFGVFVIAAAGVNAAQSEEAEAAKVEFFEKKIRPILSESCFSCHAADTKPSGGLRVDDRNGLLMGGDGGAAVVAGDSEKGLLLERILHADPKRRMPKESDPLTQQQIADLKTWIRDGAAWPRERIPSSLGKTRPEYDKLKAEHWAWQPLVIPQTPVVKDAAWAESDIDRFILAKLEAEKLGPVKDADALTLLRRVTFDLTGLPPTPEEIRAFLDDRSPVSFAKVVDRLLESKAFGERWGRHWLDVARYGESTGPSRNIPYPHAWKYRDYVLDAVNRDVPLDRFIQEQVAGDLLPSESPQERDRLLTATGFIALGVKDVNQRFKTRFIMDNVDEQIDAVTRSVLALTVSCARCHDHKFDPIPTTDYYALAGIFTSTDDCAGVRNKMGGGGLDYYNPGMLLRLSSSDVPEAPPEQVAKLQAKVDETKKAWDEIRGTEEGLKKGPDGRPVQRKFRTAYEKAQGDLMALTDPAARGLAVHGVREGSAIADTEVRIAGEAERLGPTVPRGFLTVFEFPNAPKVNPAQSGRLELAKWLTHPGNPLTPRVQVNRVWKHLFGSGIVSTVDNFGINGDKPSHPELLDYLAGQFVEDGWSTKRLIRRLVLTHAYRLGSDAPATNVEKDPANRFVWRHSPRRLDAEEMRDAMLATAGELRHAETDGSATKSLRMVEMRDNGPEARGIHQASDQNWSRSVYLPLLRGVTPRTLAAFDPVSQTLVSGARDNTTVPTQALYLLNSTFVRRQALALATKIARESSEDPQDFLQEVYELVLNRPAQAEEVDAATGYLYEYAWAHESEPKPVVLAKVDVTPATATEETTGAVVVPVNPDDVDRSEAIEEEAPIVASSPKEAAWMSLIQALYASAEFRFVR